MYERLLSKKKEQTQKKKDGEVGGAQKRPVNPLVTHHFPKYPPAGTSKKMKIIRRGKGRKNTAKANVKPSPKKTIIGPGRNRGQGKTFDSERAGGVGGGRQRCTFP